MSSKFGKDLYVIAEIGVNHAGDLSLAKKLINLAKKGGAHAAKFQSYKAHKIAAKDSPAYWDTTKEPTESQFDLFKKFDGFGEAEYVELSKYCDEIGIDFMSTPFDLEAVDFLNPLQKAIKIASADITNFPLLRRVAKCNKPVILSTGCSEIKEIHEAVQELINSGVTEVVLLHCILNYPTANSNANLNMISSLQREFPKIHIGYSDHTIPSKGMEVLCAAYTLGARVIEKHFTHDKSLQGNDHYHSMDYRDLRVFISSISAINEMIGNSDKKPLESELNSIKYARRSLHYRSNLSVGHTLKEVDLICLRPGTGVSPSLIDSLLGKRLKRSVEEGARLNLDDLEVND